MKIDYTRGWFLFLLGIVLLILDRVTKFVFTGREYFIINYVENTGGLFGLFKENILIFIVFSILILIILIAYFLRISDFKKRIALVFIFTGIFSNLIDRIFFGYVVDFIDFKFWPVFNLADVFSIIGVVLIILFGWRLKNDRN